MAKQGKGNAQFCLYTYILDLMVYLGLLRVLHPDKKEVLRQSVEGGIMPPSLWPCYKGSIICRSLSIITLLVWWETFPELVWRFCISNHYFLICICRLIGGSDFKIIYRHYATLYFVFCVDSSESELGILDLIQVCFMTMFC